MRPFSYPQTDAFIVCFSVVEPKSLQSVIDNWIPEIERFCPTAKIILVGTHLDLRNDENVENEKVQFKEGLKCSKEINACEYLECSALESVSVKNVFEAAISAVFDERGIAEKIKKRRCNLM